MGNSEQAESLEQAENSPSLNARTVRYKQGDWKICKNKINENSRKQRV